jgi:hypothetical protein
MGKKQSSLNVKQGDLTFGIILLAFSVVFYYLSYHFTGYEIEKIPNDVGPAFMPRLLLGAMVIEAIALLLQSVSSNADSARMKRVFQLRPMVMLASFVCYIYLSTFLGYIISTILFMLLAFTLLGVRGIWTLILVPPLIAFATYFLFGSVLNIYLPSGILF